MVNINDMIGKIHCGDCLEVMKQMPDKCVDLVVTSPPYDNLRTYNGFVFDFERIAKELFRIIKDGGVAVWVVGDATIDGSETGTSFKQALFFKECGFNLHDTMIYKSEKPPLTHNRYEQKFEYMFILVKGKIKTFNPILEKTKYFGFSTVRPETDKGSRKDGSAIRSKKDGGEVKEYKYIGNIWEYKTGGGLSTADSIAFEHPAIFPEKLAADHIISWSNVGDIVMDIFTGSGTTIKMAENLSRKWIGIEISKEYCAIAQARVDAERNQLKLPGMI